MKIPSRIWRRLPLRFVVGIGCSLPLSFAGEALGADRPHTLAEISRSSNGHQPFAYRAGNVIQANATEAQAQTQALVMGLPELLQLAMERQPALAAYRASLNAAQEASKALENVKMPAFIVRELPIRRRQACLGVIIASANVDQAERETVYAVTRTYYSVIFAREQQKVADGVVDHLKATLETAKRLVQGGSREVTTSSADKITVYLRLAETRQAEAAHGVERATAALKEAVGLDFNSPLQVQADQLPNPNVQLHKFDVINLALSRRAELVQASNAAQITCLEVEAQGTSCRPTFHTFASSGDIHAKPIPQGTANGEYRPGAVGPEMPVNLNGSKSARKDRARALSVRAGAVVDKTRNLVALEAEDAFLKWEEVSAKVPLTREASEKATKLADDTRKDFGGEQKVKPEDVLTNEVLAAQARAQNNEALYQQVLSLAALERVTGGGFRAGFSGTGSEAIPLLSAPSGTLPNQTGH